MALIRITPPQGGLITLDDAKRQLRLDSEDDDTLVASLIAAAGRVVQAETQRLFLSQSWRWVLDGWDDPLVLPVAGPGDCSTLSIDQVAYVDTEGAPQVLDPSQYWVRPRGQTLTVARPWFVVWPWLGDGAERLAVSFSVTGDVTTAPDEAAHAVRLLVSHWYQNRDAVVGVEGRDSSTPLPYGVEALLDSLRWEA